MSTLMLDMKETVCKLNLRDELFAEWNETTDYDTETRARICVELDGCFEYRTDWQRKHHRSYNYAIKRGLIKRKSGLNQWLGYQKLDDLRSTQAKTAEARTMLHDWCVQNSIGYWDEYKAGGYLITLMNDGADRDKALCMAKLSVQIG